MQQNLFRFAKIKTPGINREFGGSLSVQKKKTSRPYSDGMALHIVLRLNELAVGDSKKIDLLQHRKQIEDIFKQFALRSQVRLYKFAIVSNHIHILLMAREKDQYSYFVRSVSGRLAQTLKIKWQFRPYTRIITWGRDFNSTKSYVEQNHLEAIGAIPYQPRR